MKTYGAAVRLAEFGKTLPYPLAAVRAVFHHMRGKPQFGESAVLQKREYGERTVQAPDAIVKTVEYMGMTVNGTFQQPR